MTFHPDSKTMKSFEHREEEDRMTTQPRTVPNPEAAFPFPGLDAPLGG